MAMAATAGPGAGLGLGALVLGLGAWKGPGLHRDAVTGTAFGARWPAPATLWKAARWAVPRDFEPGMGMVSLSADAAAKSVTARVPAGRATATLQPGSGVCWRNGAGEV
jgi:hypothetical protein